MCTERFAISYQLSREKDKMRHTHDCYEFYYSITGGKEFFISDKRYEIQPHDVFFTCPNESHQVTCLDNEKLERVNIAIHPNFLERYSTSTTALASCFHKQGARVLNLSVENRKQFEYLIRKIGQAAGFGADLLEDMYLCRILIMLNNCWIDGGETQFCDISFSNVTAKAILQYINGHLAEEISIELLAKKFFVSQSYLCRIFKKYTGITVNKYVASRRISLAITLMDDGCQPSCVFLQVGFRNYNTFYKSFVDIVGICPKEYIKYD